MGQKNGPSRQLEVPDNGLGELIEPICSSAGGSGLSVTICRAASLGFRLTTNQQSRLGASVALFCPYRPTLNQHFPCSLFNLMTGSFIFSFTVDV